VTIEKNVNFFNGGVFFLLTRPLMGDPEHTFFISYQPCANSLSAILRASPSKLLRFSEISLVVLLYCCFIVIDNNKGLEVKKKYVEISITSLPLHMSYVSH